MAPCWSFLPLSCWRPQPFAYPSRHSSGPMSFLAKREAARAEPVGTSSLSLKLRNGFGLEPWSRLQLAGDPSLTTRMAAFAIHVWSFFHRFALGTAILFLVYRTATTWVRTFLSVFHLIRSSFLSAAGCFWFCLADAGTLREQSNHFFIERRQIGRFPAAHPVSVAYHFLVAPTRARVAQVIH